MSEKLKFLAVSVLAVVLHSPSAIGADFSKGSKAKKWGLTAEEQALFSGKVVDILCELSGDCPDNCGDGLRQLGIIRDADGKLVAVLKNSQASFNGATEDLLPYCNKQVDVDGVLIGNEEELNAKFFMVQRIREDGRPRWSKTKEWTKAWKRKNPDSAGKGPWFRRDKRVAKQIELDGYLGLGKAEDEKYIAEN